MSKIKQELKKEYYKLSMINKGMSSDGRSRKEIVKKIEELEKESEEK